MRMTTRMWSSWVSRMRLLVARDRRVTTVIPARLALLGLLDPLVRLARLVTLVRLARLALPG